MTPGIWKLLPLAAIAAVTGCTSRAQTAAPAAAPQVTVVTVHPASVPVTVELPGRTTPYLVAQVRARVDGIVLKRDYTEGAPVKAGQRLYLIDPAPYEAALHNAQATLEKSQANLVAMAAQEERYKPLVAANAVSKQDYDNAVAAKGQADADVSAGKAMVETARINLGYTAVDSPISGVSGISQVTQGAYVQGASATLMTTVQQIDPMYVDLTQSSVQGLQLRRDAASGKLKASGDGAPVTITLEDGRPYGRKGKLQFSDITVDPTTGAVTVRAIVPNPDGTLLPGMFVRASIDEGNVDGVFLVPQAGVTHDPKGQATAMVVGADGKAAARTVQVRGTHGHDWVVYAGLADGDRVIVDGVQKVKPGAAVVANEAKAASAVAANP